MNGNTKRLAVAGCMAVVLVAIVAAVATAATGREVPLWLAVVGANAGAALITVATRTDQK